jgi:hypothetical protein
MSAPEPYDDAVFGQLLTYCQKVHDLLKANLTSLGLVGISFGDQIKIPATPWLCVEPDTKSRELAGVPRVTNNTLKTYIIVYVSKVDDIEVNSADALRIAEGVEFFLHKYANLEGQVVHHFCIAVEPGYRTRAGTKFRACRLSFEAITKTALNGGH